MITVKYCFINLSHIFQDITIFMTSVGYALPRCCNGKITKPSCWFGCGMVLI
jgi:hypothetical protein